MFQPSLQDIIIVLFGLFSSILVLIVLPYFVSKYIKSNIAKKEFKVVGESFGLGEEEINVLYECARNLSEPNKLFYSKYVFEKCAGKLVKENSENIPIIVSARKKLKFEHLPWFLPLSTTRDIELYQTGFISYKGKSYGSAVWEKTEKELHIAILDRLEDIPKPGEKIKFSFLREDDGRYYFQEEILNTYFESNKIVLVLPHTEKLGKIQLRESIRWKVSIPARVFFFGRVVTPEEASLMEEMPKEAFMEGTIEDISAGGLRVCLKTAIEPKEGESLLIEFEWKNNYFGPILSEIRNVRSSTERTCVGVKFLNLKRVQEEIIRKIIIEEQREALRAYKMGL
ncbi:flagellar brake protein [Thermocrinis sp.]